MTSEIERLTSKKFGILSGCKALQIRNDVYVVNVKPLSVSKIKNAAMISSRDEPVVTELKSVDHDRRSFALASHGSKIYVSGGDIKELVTVQGFFGAYE